MKEVQKKPSRRLRLAQPQSGSLVEPLKVWCIPHEIEITLRSLVGPLYLFLQLQMAHV